MRSLDNHELFTQQEKEANKDAAYDAADAAAYTAADDADAAADTIAWGAVYTDAEYWINRFFIRTGEYKQTYIDEVERLKGE